MDWIGLDWMDGSLGLVEYRAPYGANNGCSTKSESFRFYVIVQPVCRKKLDQILFLRENVLMANFDLGWI